jgi:hypothetical protein
VAEHLVPKMMHDLTWIPELERETVALLRVFLAEKWLVTRLHYGHVDPREGGVGNVVNCGAAMYMAPVGIVNAGDPAGAYAEAADLAGAHQSSYGREAAAVFAAAVAAAMAADATVDDVLAATLDLAHDGTRDAIAAVTGAVETGTDWRSHLTALREAVRPFDSVGEDYRNPDPGRPPAQPDQGDRGAAGGPGPAEDHRRRRRRHHPRRHQLRPRLRLHRHDGRRDRRRPRWG